MKYKILTLLLLFSVISIAQQNLNIIPKPSSVEIKNGHFVLNKETVIQADENSFEAKYLQKEIKDRIGFLLKISLESNSKSKIGFFDMLVPGITFEIDSLGNRSINRNKGQYFLRIEKSEITIAQCDDIGNFYGIQTLLQLIPFEKKNEIRIPCLVIDDQPKFQWRGMHLDVSRHSP